MSSMTRVEVDVRVAELEARGKLYEAPGFEFDPYSPEGVADAVTEVHEEVMRLKDEEVAQLRERVTNLEGHVDQLQGCVKSLLVWRKRVRA